MPPGFRPLRILFTHFVDGDNYNAQSLNIREIARRLDPGRFVCTFFFLRNPDPRLVPLPHARLLRIPARLGSLVMVKEALRGHDLLFSPGLDSRFCQLYFQIPKVFRKPTRTIYWIEGGAGKCEEEWVRDVRRRFDRYASQMEYFVGITEAVARASRERYGILAREIIPVGVDTQVFSPVRRPLERKISVLFVGHLIERKKPQLILEAARSFPQAFFRLVGRTRDNFLGILRAQAAANRLGNVEFFEPMPQRALAELMHESDILLHPSQTEGMPKVVLEASATGMPAIIFNTYGAPVVMDGVTGYQVSTTEEMLDRLGRLIESPDRRHRLGEAAAEHAKQFEWEIVARRWEDILTRVAHTSS